MISFTLKRTKSTFFFTRMRRLRKRVHLLFLRALSLNMSRGCLGKTIMFVIQRERGQQPGSLFLTALLSQHIGDESDGVIDC
jgi:hypothetical protein